MDFVIPQQPEQLLKQKPNSYHVDKLVDTVSLSKQNQSAKLDVIEKSLKKSPLTLSNQENFDTLYSYVYNFDTFEESVKKKLVGTLSCIGEKMCLHIKEKCTDLSGDTKLIKNNVKMITYLIHFCISKLKESKDKVESLRETLISTYANITELDLSQIWKLDKPEVEFSNLIYSSCTDALEQQVNLKHKSLKSALIKTIVGISRFSDLPVSSILNSAMKHEFLIVPLTDLFVVIEKENNKAPCLAELLLEIGKVDNIEADSDGAKLLGAFIEEFSEKLPNVVLANLSLIISHLDDSVYQMRNAVLVAVSRVIHHIHTDKEQEKTRESLFEILLERIKDNNAYTRSKTVQCWTWLIENNSVPLKLLPQVVGDVVDRLQDKSAFVRKSVLQFLIKMLEKNPFGDSLSRSFFLNGLEEVKKRIATELELSPSEKQNLTTMAGYYSEVLAFIEQINKIIPFACRLLDSKTSTDVLACMEFFSVAHSFQIEDAMYGIKAMLKLIFSREQSLHDGLLEEFQRLFLAQEQLKSPESCIAAAASIVKLVTCCNLAELTFLENIVKEIVRKDLHKTGKEHFPKLITLAVKELVEKDDVGAMILYAMIASGSAEIIKLMPLVNQLSKSPNLARHICAIIEKYNEKQDANHALFQVLTDIMLGESLNLNEWIPFAEKAISIVYSKCTTPLEIAHDWIKKLAEKTKLSRGSVSNVNVSTIDLSKLCFTLGHAILKELVFVEHQHKEKRVLNEKKMEQTELEKATQNDNETDEWLAEQERMLVDPFSVFGSFLPLIVTLASNEEYKDTMIRRGAVLTLCKYMCIHSSVCEKNIQLLFSLLESGSPIIRSNIIVSLGDLACRFPNIVEPWIGKLYSCLKDSDDAVRKKTMMVLTHLILSDMIKGKTNMTEMVKCIHDKDPSIVNLTKSFFTELSKRGTVISNPIYNMLPDVISRLSMDETEESFRDVLKFLLSFITKDKQTDQLVEKLCHRFKQAVHEKEWRNTAFCLSQLSHNVKSINKLVSSIKMYQHSLQDDQVFDLFIGIKEKALKENSLKETLADWEEEMCKVRGVEVKRSSTGDENSTLNQGGETPVVKKTTSSRNRVKKPTSTKETKTKTTRGKKKVVEEEEEEEEEKGQEEEEEEEAPKKSSRGRKKVVMQEPDQEEEKVVKPKSTRTRRKKVEEDDYEE